MAQTLFELSEAHFNLMTNDHELEKNLFQSFIDGFVLLLFSTFN